MPTQRNQRRSNLDFDRTGNAAGQQNHQDALAGVQYEHERRGLAAGRAQNVRHSRASAAEIPDVLSHHQVYQHVTP